VNERLKKYLSFQNDILESLKFNEISQLYDNFSLDPKFLSKMNGNPLYNKSSFVKGKTQILKQ